MAGTRWDWALLKLSSPATTPLAEVNHRNHGPNRSSATWRNWQGLLCRTDRAPRRDGKSAPHRHHQKMKAFWLVLTTIPSTRPSWSILRHRDSIRTEPHETKTCRLRTRDSKWIVQNERHLPTPADPFPAGRFCRLVAPSGPIAPIRERVYRWHEAPLLRPINGCSVRNRWRGFSQGGNRVETIHVPIFCEFQHRIDRDQNAVTRPNLKRGRLPPMHWSS